MGGVHDCPCRFAMRARHVPHAQGGEHADVAVVGFAVAESKNP